MRQEKKHHSKGYILIYSPKHPFCNGAGYVPEHRLVMEKKIGKVINPRKFDVHHLDHNEQNNTLANLVLLTKTEHRREHSGWKKIDGEWWKTCRRCNQFKKVENNFYRRYKGHNEYVTFCIPCCKKIGQDRKPPIKDKEVKCKVCKKLFFTNRWVNPQHCSIKCSWVTRKEG